MDRPPGATSLTSHQMKILFLTQVPCSAGSYLTRYIAKASGIKCIIDETNPLAFKFITSRFQPVAPSVSAYKRGLISQATANKLYENNLLDLLEKLRIEGQREIIIRDHAYSQWFEDEDPDSFDWIHFFESNNLDYFIILSHRNPYDSYLSLNKSFPHLAVRTDFDSYCKKYLLYVASYIEKCPPSKFYFASIDIFSDPFSIKKLNYFQHVLMMWLEKKVYFKDISLEINETVTSGSSGRYGTVPTKMSRYSCCNKLNSELLSSTTKTKLLQLLGYPNDYNPRYRDMLVHFLFIITPSRSALVRLLKSLKIPSTFKP